jgi:hypothetical protein
VLKGHFPRDVGHMKGSVLETANPRVKQVTDTRDKAVPSGECDYYLL